MSASNTMDNKDNLDDGSTNDDPGFRGNSTTSNTQQAASDTHESRVSPYFVTRDPSVKRAGAVTNTMDKDGLWCGGLWSILSLSLSLANTMADEACAHATRTLSWLY